MSVWTGTAPNPMALTPRQAPNRSTPRPITKPTAFAEYAGKMASGRASPVTKTKAKLYNPTVVSTNSVTPGI